MSSIKEKFNLQSHEHDSVFLIEDRSQINKLAELAQQGTLDTLSRSDFKHELSQWVRNNWTKQPDGMPGYAMGMPAAISLISPLMIKIAPIHKQAGPKIKLQTASASAVAIIATANDSPIDWMNAGQLLEKIWLEATTAKLAAAPLAATIEASEAIRRDTQKVIGGQRLPQAMLRIGHSLKTNLRATPRRTIADCLLKR